MQPSKRCNKCGSKGPFSSNRSNKDGLSYICKECSREYSRAWRAANLDYARKKARAWRKANLERARQRDRDWYRENKENGRNKNLKQHYGISLAEWEKLFDSQKRRCACCGTNSNGKRRWSTDHCHETAVIRGILCSPCNMLIGALGDSLPQIKKSFSRIVTYLKKKPVHPGRRKHWYSKKQLAEMKGARK